MLPGGHIFSCAMPERDPPSHSCSLLRGWHGPPQKSSPLLLQQAAASRLNVRACRDVPMQHCASRPALPSPHSPSSAGTRPRQLWLSARPGLQLALVNVCSASSHTVFTSLGASAICCTDFTQVLRLRCQCVFGGSLTAPREMSCPWRGALVVGVQARTPQHPHGRPKQLLRSQAGSHVHWHTLPRLPTTCCSLMALNRAPAAATAGTRLRSLTAPGPVPDPPPPGCWVDALSCVLTLPGTSPELAAVPLPRSVHSAA